MVKQEIILQLEQKHHAFDAYLNSLSKEEYELQSNGKWSAGQQQAHILKSVKALAKGLKIPKLILWWRIGKANRPSRSYDELVARYHEKLALVVPGTSNPFGVDPVSFESREILSQKYRRYVETLKQQLSRYSEKQMDTYILPHPLLGKITIREMMYFTIYHCEHHHNLTMKNLPFQEGS